MKKILISLSISLISCFGWAQSVFKSMRVSADVELIQISSNAYLHVSYINSSQYGRIGANGLIVVDKGEALLFDTPWNVDQTNDLVNWLADSMQVQITGFVANHWHEDCMGGVEVLKQRNVKTYAHQLTVDIAKERGLPVSEYPFSGRLELKLGEIVVECYFLGAAHSMDNIVVWVPSQKILFAGCMVKGLNSVDLGNTVDGDLNAYPSTIKLLMEKFPDAKVVIPGHGGLGGFELLDHTLKLACNRL
jgi:metallo-beta-lactamase class B